MVGLSLKGATLDEGRAVRLVGLRRPLRRIDGIRRGRRGRCFSVAERLAGRCLGDESLPLSVGLGVHLGGEDVVLRREALLLTDEGVAAALQTSRRRQRSLAFDGEPVEGHPPFHQGGSRGFQRRRDAGVLALGRFELGRETALLLRPGVVGGLLRVAGELGDQTLALRRRGALDLIQQVLSLLGEAADALEPAVEHASAQQPPRTALALRDLPGERLLLMRPRRCYASDPFLSRRALTLDLGELLVTTSQVAIDDDDIAGQKTTPRLGDLALHGAQLFRRRRLPAQGRELRAHLALEKQSALQIAANLAQLELGALAAALVRPQPRRLLDLAPPVLRLAGEERLHLALADDRVQFLAEADLGEEFDDVRQAAGRLVHGVV